MPWQGLERGIIPPEGTCSDLYLTVYKVPARGGSGQGLGWVRMGPLWAPCTQPGPRTDIPGHALSLATLIFDGEVASSVSHVYGIPMWLHRQPVFPLVSQELTVVHGEKGWGQGGQL